MAASGGVNGSANLGGGGGGSAAYPPLPATGSTGGSGVVIVKEAAIAIASSCWDLRQVYRQIKADEWI